MNDYRHEGQRINRVVPTGGATGGDVYALATGATGFIGVWLDTYAASATGVLLIEGVFELPKATGASTDFAVGQLVYWDDASNQIEHTATGNVRAGRCVELTTTSATTCLVKINLP